MKTQDLLRRSGRNTSQRYSVPFERSTRHRRVGRGVEPAAPQTPGAVPKSAIAGRLTHGCVSELAVVNRKPDFERDTGRRSTRRLLISSGSARACA